ncbi:DUF2490 domain-containing protein [Pontiellaceae bacterium B12227]|nr:DUF2490 domain-containing protein [Pontiellaceae bacterium B12227]
MKYKLYAAIAWVTLGMVLHCQAWDASENIIRLQGSVKGSLTESTTLKLTENLRYTHEGSFHYYSHTELEMGWKFAENWNLAPAFRYISARTQQTDWQGIPVWILNLNNTARLKVIDIKTRLRVLHSDLDQVGDRTDFRPKFSVQPADGFTQWDLKPYLADELIYNFQDNRFYRNRISGGIKLRPANVLALDLFIMQELTRIGSRNDWTERYNLGLSAAILF